VTPAINFSVEVHSATASQIHLCRGANSWRVSNVINAVHWRWRSIRVVLHRWS